MSCGIDLQDYFWGELTEADKAAADRHLAGCATCALELDQLRAVRGNLMLLRDEEPPQRIGFVSDKVFEPSPVRRWLSSFWLSGARVGFASAAMLAIALLVFAARQPKVVETRVEVARAAPQVDMKAVVDEAVKTALAEQEKKTQALLAASERHHRAEESALALRVSDYVDYLEKRAVRDRQLVAYGNSVGGQ
jgi:anti-sigma factor RsiW